MFIFIIIFLTSTLLLNINKLFVTRIISMVLFIFYSQSFNYLFTEYKVLFNIFINKWRFIKYQIIRISSKFFKLVVSLTKQIVEGCVRTNCFMFLRWKFNWLFYRWKKNLTITNFQQVHKNRWNFKVNIQSVWNLLSIVMIQWV